MKSAPPPLENDFFADNSSPQSIRGLNIVYQTCQDLAPASRNPRTHTKKQILQIVKSIQEFGFTNPILVDKNNIVIAGHGRLEAAKLLNMTHVPTICLGELSEYQIRAYIIADNKLAENAGWDAELLGLELQYLSKLEIDFDISVIGFETAEIDVLIGDLDTPEGEADSIPEIAAGPSITQPDDIWQIGPHRLICGDATKAQTYEQLLENQLAQMIFTDPPYNVPINGHVSGLGHHKHREFAMATGEMTQAQFIDFLKSTFDHLSNFSMDGALQFICMDWRHMKEVMEAADEPFNELKNLCVWAKTNGGMGSLYRSQHELVFVYKNGRAPHINNVALGQYGRYRTNVWTYPGMSSFSDDRDAELALHPTVKPLKLVEDAILDCSDRGGLILDAFAGSGTTLLAAETTGRCGYGIEIDPHYCDVILRRFIQQGLTPIHCITGEHFSNKEIIIGEQCHD